MTDRQFIEWMQVEVAWLGEQIDLHLQLEPPPGETPSPTGREPRLIWTPARQRVFNQMVAEREAGLQTLGATWADLIFDNAHGNRYGDSGLWATLAYQMTGDALYIDLAWQKIEAMLGSALDDDNNTRELSMERVIMLDWLWPGLTEARRTQYFEALDRMFTNASTPAVRTTDSDQTTGVYMGVACYHVAFGDIHPKATEFFSLPGVGGLDSTARDRTTMRNAILDYLEMATGGEWIESSEYNLGTVRLLTIGAAAIQTATKVDHFPEVTAWLESGATRYASMLTPDLRQSFQWGDEQHPHNLQVWMWSSTAMCFDHPVARGTVLDLVEQFGARGSYTAEPISRAFLMFDPYGETAPLASPVFNASGQGIVSARSTRGTMVCIHLPPTYPVGLVDHAVKYFGDVQLYRDSWWLTHPITYSGVGVDGRGINSMLTRGIGSPVEWRGSGRVYSGADWVFAAATSGGTILASKFYQPPPTFWHEWSRSILWIQGDGVETLIVFDRSHCDDPLTLGRVAAYPDDLEKKFKENPLRQWRWHAPVAPVVSGQSATWPIEGGQVRVSWLSDDLTACVVDQTVAWSNITQMEPDEKKWHLELHAPDIPGFATLITVLECGDPTKFAAIRRHDDPGDQAVAVCLSRSGQADQVALFNDVAGPKLPSCASSGAYNPAIPGMLESVRFRDYQIPGGTGARVWGMESQSGVPVSEP